jgi:hypothetical protein
LVPVAVFGLALAACGSPSASVPGESSAGEPSTPAESQAGGGGGGGGIGGGTGSVTFNINGGYTDSGELPFAGNYAYWQVAGVTFLVFTDDTDATEANGVILTISEEGNIFQYVTDDIVIPAAECDWDVRQNDASGAAGSFSCSDQSGFGTGGELFTDLDISGDFDVDH